MVREYGSMGDAEALKMARELVKHDHDVIIQLVQGRGGRAGGAARGGGGGRGRAGS